MSIPASAIVNMLPSVVSGGGTGLVLNGVMLTTSYRVPIGTVQVFSSDTAVGEYFGETSLEFDQSEVYFNSFTGASQQPGSLIVAQYNQTDVPAWLQSGPIDSLTVPQLAAISGSLNIVIDGYTRTVSSLNLSGATSYTAAATLIAAALNTTEPTEAAVTASISPGTFSITGSVADEVLNVITVTSGTVVVGAMLTGSGMPSGAQILEQLSGTPGGVGTYGINKLAAVALGSFTGTYGTMTVSAITSGTVSPGQTVTGGSTAAGTVVTAYGTGSGLLGTYIVNLTQTVSSGALTCVATNVSVTFDSVSGGFLIQSGILGSASTIAYASGTAATPLMLTQATGAIISQGAALASPGAFMSALTGITQNWATFWTAFNPDDTGNSAKLAFAAWTNAQNNRYAYLAWDSDITPTLSAAATTSLGYLIENTYEYSGTSVWYDPNNQGLAAFQAGIAASLNFNAVNGRTTFAFRKQPGLVATVSNQQVGSNLLANGYNFYGDYATANQQFVWNYNGSVSGQFNWLDSFINQIWMNNQFQLALMELLGSVGSIPYDTTGYTMVAQTLQSDIQQAINFGAIRQGVQVSSEEAVIVNNQAGFAIDQILSTQGWFFLIQPVTAQVRQARSTPTIYFWYMDGESIQSFTVNSVLVE